MGRVQCSGLTSSKDKTNRGCTLHSTAPRVLSPTGALWRLMIGFCNLSSSCQGWVSDTLTGAGDTCGGQDRCEGGDTCEGQDRCGGWNRCEGWDRCGDRRGVGMGRL